MYTVGFLLFPCLLQVAWATCCLPAQLSGSAVEIVKSVVNPVEIRPYPDFPRMSCGYGPETQITQVNLDYAIDFDTRQFYEHIVERSSGIIVADKKIYVDFVGAIDKGYFVDIFSNGTEACNYAKVNVLELIFTNLGNMQCFPQYAPRLPDVNFMDCTDPHPTCNGLMPNSQTECNRYHQAAWYPADTSDLVANSTITMGFNLPACELESQLMSIVSHSGALWEGARADFYDTVNSLPSPNIFDPPAICSGATSAGCCFSDQMSGEAFEIVKVVSHPTEVVPYPDFPRMACGYGSSPVVSTNNFTYAVDYTQRLYYEHMVEVTEGDQAKVVEIYLDFQGVIDNGYFVDTFPNGTQECTYKRVNTLELLLPHIGELQCYPQNTPELTDISFSGCEQNEVTCSGLMPNSPSQCVRLHESKWYPTDAFDNVLAANISLGVHQGKCHMEAQLTSTENHDGSFWEGARVDFFNTVSSLPSPTVFDPPAICSQAKTSTSTGAKSRKLGI